MLNRCESRTFRRRCSNALRREPRPHGASRSSNTVERRSIKEPQPRSPEWGVVRASARKAAVEADFAAGADFGRPEPFSAGSAQDPPSLSVGVRIRPCAFSACFRAGSPPPPSPDAWAASVRQAPHAAGPQTQQRRFERAHPGTRPSDPLARGGAAAMVLIWSGSQGNVSSLPAARPRS